MHDMKERPKVRMPDFPIPDESIQTIKRVTQDGRNLLYQLSVIQQPDQARACGSGQKANSDRRPVDPPPVVELRIIEGHSVDTGRDITFEYDAHFFLFASLEHCRTIAQPRNAPAVNPPILTGVPASGMAYLDRPKEAGYFIFPDLSVRHEGIYVLNFSLFESTRHQADLDSTDAECGVDFRMSVKTRPFQVFSAKKFPGLEQSTQLSIMVAEQGCRVRIRREIRMRKRDKGNFDHRAEDRNRHRTVTPATEDPMRPRSLSNSSQHRLPYPEPVSRRPSNPPPFSPATPHSGHTGPSQLGFLAGPHSAAPRFAPPSTKPPPSQTGPYPPMQPVEHHASHYSSPAYHGRHEHGRKSSSYSMMDGSRTRSDSNTSNYSHVPPSPSKAPADKRLTISSIVSAPALEANSVLEAQTLPMIKLPSITTGGKRKVDDVSIPEDTRVKNGQRAPAQTFSPVNDGPVGAYYQSADGQQNWANFNTFYH